VRLTVYGARGSIPVSGPEFIRYGGDTTCASVETADGNLLVLDAGTGLRALGNRIMEEGRKEIHFLLSHAHWDHILGFPFFKPLYREDTVIHFHGCKYAQQSVKTVMRTAMQPPYFPVRLDDVEARVLFDEECPPVQEICGLRCQAILLNHPNFGYGFRLTENGRSLAFFPDNELTFAHPKGGRFETYAAFVEGVDLLIHDGEFTPDEYESFSRGWGHSVYLDTVRLALEARAAKLLLWHLNQDRADDDVDAMLEAARTRVSESGSDMACEMARVGLRLEV
jgi:ribonuclease BN (tRNA processing enzyme)